jgi:sugar lactone lactonase YvrE
VDEYRKKIQVYNSNGLNIGSIGKAGGDPGEFQKPGDLFIDGKYLYAYDESLFRVYAYDLDRSEFGTFTQINISDKLGVDSLQNSNPNQLYVTSDGNYLVGFQKVNAPDDRTLHFFKINTAGQVISEELMSFKSKSLYVDNTMTNQVIMMLPYEKETLLAANSKNRLFTVNTEDFLIKVWDEKGNYLRAHEYPFEKRDLVQSDVVDLFTNVHQRRAIRGADLPDEWPAVARLLIDDEDRLWVATITENLENYRWFVLDNSGEALGTFEFPRKSVIKTIKDNLVYAVELNRRYYSEEVVRYKIDL